MRRLSVLAGALLGALAVAASAAADAPVVQVQRWEQSYVTSSPCGFPVAVDGWVEQTHRTWSDGTVAGTRTVSWIRAEFTWLAPSGRAVRIDQNWKSETEMFGSPSTQTITGVLTRVVGPGAGVLLNDVGRLVLALGGGAPGPPVVLSDHGGQDSIFEPGVWDPVCSYLAA
jgi:hypothetical protein